MAAHNLNDERPRTTDVEFDRSLEFSKMFLSEPVVRGLTRSNFIHPSPIQARAIPLAKLGLDLLVQAKSGTGKTLVFAVMIAENHNPDVDFPQSLTIVPTREIAVQIEDVLNRVGYSLPGFRAKSFIGGLDVAQDRKKLQSCSAVVGTPGRINHLIKSNVLNTSQIKILVLDEADSLITGTMMKAEVNQIVKSLPTKRQTVVCSATFYNNRDRELCTYLNEKFIGVTPKKEIPVLQGIRQFVREMPEAEDNIKEVMAKIAELNQILKKVPYGQCLVFANTQTKAETYCSYLSRAGWPTEVIRGGQEQRVRLKTVENLKKFRCRVLTATDVISRGIDAENVNLVVNVDVPKDNSIYLHRIGRAGRFGTQAVSITLVSSPKEMERFRKILHDIGGNEAFVYHLPTEKMEEIWSFEQYGNKYSKLYASTLEQKIRDQGADRSFLETIIEVDSKTELGQKSSESVALEDSLEEKVKQVEVVLSADSLDSATKQPQKADSTPNSLCEPVPPENAQNQPVDPAEEEEEVLIRRIPLDCPIEEATDEVDNMFLAAMGKLDAEVEQQKQTQLELVSQSKLQFGDSEIQLVLDGSENEPACSSTVMANVDDLFLAAMDKLELEDANKVPASEENSLIAHQTQLDIENGNVEEFENLDQNLTEFTTSNGGELVDDLFLAAMQKVDLEEQQSTEEASDKQSSSTPSSELTCSTPESCYTTEDSSFSSNATKKVEVGSNFTTPNSRVQEIRGAVPDHQVSSSSSNNSSEIDRTSDPGIPTQPNCPLEVNNDALFAKIMEQKELEAGQQQRPFQFSIDGCSLEVHDDPISDRDINSRKGSVPDVVPSAITIDPSRLQQQPSVEEEEEDAANFDLNSNTCGSNHGSAFEPEEAVVPQDNRPKRIRFQQQQQQDDNSIELQSNSVGVIPGGASQQGDQPEVDPLALPPIPDTVSAAEEADDASSYSSQYDSESSNSSFFDQRVWEAPRPSSANENPAAEAEPQQPDQSQSHEPTESKKRKVSKRSKNATNRYHRLYHSWTTNYWNQMTVIQDYVRFAAYARHNAVGN